MDYFLMVKNDRRGPCTAQWISTGLSNHTISPDTLVWREGLADWTTVSKLPELSSHFEKANSPGRSTLIKLLLRIPAIVLLLMAVLSALIAAGNANGEMGKVVVGEIGPVIVMCSGVWLWQKAGGKPSP